MADRFTEEDRLALFARADEAIRGQWRNVDFAQDHKSPLDFGMELSAARVLTDQLHQVLSPLGYCPPRFNTRPPGNHPAQTEAVRASAPILSIDLAKVEQVLRTTK